MNQVGMRSLLLLVLLFIPLIFLQRVLQREIQSIFLLITHQADISMALFSLLFLPGVLLHETSHFVMAKLLGVRTGRFSLIPKRLGDGRLQLGYVETAATDYARDALIGAAPLFAGGIFVAYVGVSQLGLNTLWDSLIQGEAGAVRTALKSITGQPDFWLWFYLIFTVSSTMTPSASDRRAWLPVLLVVSVLAALVLLVGAGPWLVSRLGTFISSAVDAITVVFGTTVLIHLVLLAPLWLLRKLISRVSGYQVV